MKIIVDKNATGKTRKLIQYSLENDIPILALTNNKAISLKEKSFDYFEKPVKIITLEDLFEGNIEIPNILVDDIEKAFMVLLKSYVRPEFNVELAGFTLTNED